MSSRLILTPGDPAGIGPDITVQIAQNHYDAQIIVVANKQLLLQRAQQLNLPLMIHDYDATQASEYSMHQSGELIVHDVPLATPVIVGKSDANNATYVLNTLDIATQYCLDKKFTALVTGPINKANINAARIDFSGHTEYLAQRSHVPLTVMMLANQHMRVALATIHVALTQVPALITEARLTQVLQIIHQSLQTQFKISHPKILVCGLNPHAGEQGVLGREEIDIIVPTLEKLRKHNIHLQGPLPADTVFTEKYLKHADVVLAMYHDQGLPVIKHAGFGQTANITLGLPFIRTSVDHGTAYDLAGSKHADASSLDYAIHQAMILCEKQHD